MFCQAAFQVSGLQHVWVPGVVPPQVQSSAASFVDLSFHFSNYLSNKAPILSLVEITA